MSKPQFSSAELEVINDSVNLLAETLKIKGVNIPDDLRNQVLAQSLLHHLKHIGQLKIRQLAVDPYKIITWFGVFLAQKCDPHSTVPVISHCTVRTLNYCLSREAPLGGMAENTLSLIEDFLVNELENRCEFGIGKNGLFVGFHTAAMMKRKTVRTIRQGWGANPVDLPAT